MIEAPLAAEARLGASVDEAGTNGGGGIIALGAAEEAGVVRAAAVDEAADGPSEEYSSRPLATNLVLLEDLRNKCKGGPDREKDQRAVGVSVHDDTPVRVLPIAYHEPLEEAFGVRVVDLLRLRREGEI